MEEKYVISVNCRKEYLTFRELERILGSFSEGYEYKGGLFQTPVRAELSYKLLVNNGDQELLNQLIRTISEELIAISGDEALEVKINPFK